VGVNKFNQTEPSPLSGGEDSGILTVDPQVEVEAVDKIKAWRAQRDNGAVEATLAALRQAAEAGENIMEPSIACAKAGVTTGEWGQVLRDVFGEYRAPTGVGKAARVDGDDLSEVRDAVNATSDKLGRRLKILVGKPGLDGHSNGAEQIAVRARDSGMEVVYQGIRLTPEQIVNTALEEGVHVVGLSILSGSHLALVGDVMQQMKEAELDDVPVIVGGIIPPADEEELKSYGVSAVYTPKDFQLNEIMKDIADLVGKQA
jgi:(2R)-ethylmalonyl-CoA mutase